MLLWVHAEVGFLFTEGSADQAAETVQKPWNIIKSFWLTLMNKVVQTPETGLKDPSIHLWYKIGACTIRIQKINENWELNIINIRPKLLKKMLMSFIWEKYQILLNWKEMLIVLFHMPEKRGETHFQLEK